MGGKKLFLFALCATVALCVPSLAAAGIISFTAHLEGAQEVPPVDTPAKGLGLFTLDTNTGVFDWQVIFFPHLLSSPETAAHIHGPAAAGVNAGVIIDLGVGSPKFGSQVLTPEQQDDLKAGLWYVNIHTTANPPGEIRGQILPGVPIKVIIPEPSSLALSGLGALGLAFLLVLRRK